MLAKMEGFFPNSASSRAPDFYYIIDLGVILSYQILNFCFSVAFEFRPTLMSLKKPKQKKSQRNNSREQNISHLRVFRIPPS